MSENAIGNGEKRLTINDPVSAEVISALRQIAEARADIGLELLAVEQRKIHLLAGAKKLDEQHSRLFQGILIERGCPANALAELDAKTGKILLTPEPDNGTSPS